MSEIVLKTENISKQYRLGQLGTGTISHDINRWWHKVRGKEDPYLKVGDANDRSIAGGSDYVWSLKDINFEIQQGEVLGIIGKNGAGKSTLLKILSQVTTPTTGEVKIKGRVAALLEVGTGFHPDLTGCENVYLNGAILGMTKAEIKSKFDEIVDFSGVEKYIDTPVKRYSSGMMVRLGFAVAAHLEPEILIVDEVLAVGDAEFQKKCLGKMKDVSGQGRTVLFVSHNMTAIKGLCTKCICLKHGILYESGKTEEVINNYLLSQMSSEVNLCYNWSDTENMPQNEFQKIFRYELIPEKSLGTSNDITINTPFRVELEFDNLIEGTFNLILSVYNFEDTRLFVTSSPFLLLKKGRTTFVCNFPNRFFNDGIYKFAVGVVREGGEKGSMDLQEKISVEFLEDREASSWHGKWPGLIRPFFDWEIKN